MNIPKHCDRGVFQRSLVDTPYDALKTHHSSFPKAKSFRTDNESVAQTEERLDKMFGGITSLAKDYERRKAE